MPQSPSFRDQDQAHANPSNLRFTHHQSTRRMPGEEEGGGGNTYYSWPPPPSSASSSIDEMSSSADPIYSSYSQQRQHSASLPVSSTSHGDYPPPQSSLLPSYDPSSIPPFYESHHHHHQHQQQPNYVHPTRSTSENRRDNESYSDGRYSDFIQGDACVGESALWYPRSQLSERQEQQQEHYHSAQTNGTSPGEDYAAASSSTPSSTYYSFQGNGGGHQQQKYDERDVSASPTESGQSLVDVSTIHASSNVNGHGHSHPSSTQSNIPNKNLALTLPPPVPSLGRGYHSMKAWSWGGNGGVREHALTLGAQRESSNGAYNLPPASLRMGTTSDLFNEQLHLNQQSQPTTSEASSPPYPPPPYPSSTTSTNTKSSPQAPHLSPTSSPDTRIMSLDTSSGGSTEDPVYYHQQPSSVDVYGSATSPTSESMSFSSSSASSYQHAPGHSVPQFPNHHLQHPRPPTDPKYPHYLPFFQRPSSSSSSAGAAAAAAGGGGGVTKEPLGTGRIFRSFLAEQASVQ